jgi:membrane protein DedA with SNARE-associated domain
MQALVVIGLPVAAGIGIGSSAVYAIAHVGGKPAIDRYGRWLGVSWTDVEAIERRVSVGHRDELTLFGLRLIPVIPGVAISAFCGAIRYRYRPFIITTLAGSYVRAVLLGIIGWQAGELYMASLDRIDQLEHYLLIPIVLALGYGVFRYWKSKRSRALPHG